MLVLVSLLASTVLCVVAYRLAMLQRPHPSFRCKCRWHASVLSNVLLGYGCIGFITAPLVGWHVSHLSLTALFVGVALTVWPKRRRSTDR